MRESRRILCVGRIYCDLIFPSERLPGWGEEVFADGFACLAGGGAFITAAHLAAFGHSVRLAGSVGAAPPFGEIISRDLTRCGIDGDLLRDGGAAQVTVAVAGAQDRAFLTHRAPDPVSCPDAQDFDHLHVGELQSLIECPALLALARRAGATISCDCGDEAAYPAEADDLIAQLDLFLPSWDEAAALEASGIALDGLPHLVLKKGAEGAQARVDGHWHRHRSTPVEAVDPTGAGDAFNGGYLDGWLRADPVAVCLERGALCGATAVQHLGGWGGCDVAARALAPLAR